MVRGRRPTSQGWRVFLDHSREIAAIDFFTVVTLNFRILICLSFSGTIDGRSFTSTSQVIRRGGGRPAVVEAFPCARPQISAP